MELMKSEETRLRRQMLEFCRRVLEGNGSAEELQLLPQILAQLTEAQDP